MTHQSVALRKESVDRNILIIGKQSRGILSLSARRAWIEITLVQIIMSGYAKVALRKESVDRNYSANAVDQILPGSLSARRAWIEIVYGLGREV